MLSGTIAFLQSEGVVSEDCKPYASGVGINGFCKMSCTDWTKPYTKYYCKKGSISAPVQYDAIMEELMTNGPM